MFKYMFLAAAISLPLTTQAMAAQDMYCSSNTVSATLFLHASENLYTFKQNEGGPRVVEKYNAESNTVADTSDYLITFLPQSQQALIKFKKSGLEFTLSCQ